VEIMDYIEGERLRSFAPDATIPCPYPTRRPPKRLRGPLLSHPLYNL
jgi:hypothetical protein